MINKPLSIIAGIYIKSLSKPHPSVYYSSCTACLNLPIFFSSKRNVHNDFWDRYFVRHAQKSYLYFFSNSCIASTSAFTLSIAIALYMEALKPPTER